MVIVVTAYTHMDQVIVSAVDQWRDTDGILHNEFMGRVVAPAPRGWAGESCDGLALVAEMVAQLAYGGIVTI